MVRKLLGLFLLLAAPGFAFAQGGRFDSVAQKNVQNFLAPIPGATITICQAGATGAPCSPVVPTIPVTLCTDATCSTAAANPFLADSSGNFGGWLLPGTYVYSITGTGVTGKTFNLTIPPVSPVNLATGVTGTLPGANMSAVNLAASGNGGVTGTLPGANYAAVNLAAGNVNGGATGTLPAANLPATTGQCTGVQFSRGQAAGGSENCATPPTFVASGASHAVGYVPDPGASAGTTHFLREDATWATVPAAPAVTAVDLTAQGANIGATTILTTSANGYYRASCYIVVTRAATTSSTTPICIALWTDADSGVAGENMTIANSTSTNALGANSLTTQAGAFYAKSGTTIQYQTSLYASSGATSMQYALHIRLEGPF